MNDRKGLTQDADIRQMQRELELAATDAPAIKRKEVRKQVLKIAVNVCFAAVVIILTLIMINVLVAKSNGETASVFGYRIYVVESGSMEPTFRVGAMIVSKSTDAPEDLTVGTVVTFRNADNLRITHRITERVIGEDGSFKGYRTKGDNPINDTDVEILSPDRVEAVFLFKLPF